MSNRGLLGVVIMKLLKVGYLFGWPINTIFGTYRMKFKQIDIKNIEAILAEEDVVAPYGDWMLLAATNLGKIIQKSPRNYRNYGPYWYRIKRILIAYGFDYSEEFEGDIIDESTPDHVVLASGIMLSAQLASDAVFSNIHYIESDEDSPFKYVLEDEELELLIMEKAAASL